MRNRLPVSLPAVAKRIARIFAGTSRYSLKPPAFLLAGIREYVTEHEDKELARKFVGLHDDTKRLHGICSKYADLNKAAFRTGVAYLSMEVIRQYFFPVKRTKSKYHRKVLIFLPSQ